MGRVLRRHPARKRARLARRSHRHARRGRGTLQHRSARLLQRSRARHAGRAVRRSRARARGAARVRPPHRRAPLESAVARRRLGAEAVGDGRACVPAVGAAHGLSGRRRHPLPARPGGGVRRVVPRPRGAEGRCGARHLGSRRRELLSRPGRLARDRAGRRDAVDAFDDDADERAIPRRWPAPLARSRRARRSTAS